MIDLILESPFIVAVIGSVIVLALLWLWLQTGRIALLWTAIATLAIFAGLYILGNTIETDRENLTKMLDATTAELRNNEFEKLKNRIHPAADVPVRNLVQYAEGFHFDYAAIKKVHEMSFSGQKPDEKAVVKMNVVVEVTGHGIHQTIPRYVELTLYRVEDQWLIFDVRHEEPTYAFRNQLQ